MNNNIPKPTNFQPASVRELLEKSKISRLPKHKPYNLDAVSLSPTATACVGCGGKLELDNDFQQKVKVCRKCLNQYAKVDLAIDEAAKLKRRELLEKIVGGVQ